MQKVNLMKQDGKKTIVLAHLGDRNGLACNQDTVKHSVEFRGGMRNENILRIN